MSDFPPSGCWSCGLVPPREDIAVRGVLQARRASDGGPVTRFRCPACDVETVVEPVPGGDPVLAPPETAGLEPKHSGLLIPNREDRERRRAAEAWQRQWSAALENLRNERGFRAARAAAGPAPDPPPPPPRPRKKARRAKAAAPPPPPRDPDALPATPAEARAVLGVDTGATRKEIDRAFRTASRKCHPDLVAHLDPEFQVLADRKFRRLKRAHDLLAGSR